MTTEDVDKFVAANRSRLRADPATMPGDQGLPGESARDRTPRRVPRGAEGEGEGGRAAEGARPVSRQDFRHHRRASARARQRGGHHRRVLGLPLPVLPQRAGDVDAVAREIPDPGAPGLQALPARRSPPAGATRRRGELVCAAAEQVLGIPRRGLRQPARRQRVDDLGARDEGRAGHEGVRRVPVVGQGELERANADRRGRALRCGRNAPGSS